MTVTVSARSTRRGGDGTWKIAAVAVFVAFVLGGSVGIAPLLAVAGIAAIAIAVLAIVAPDSATLVALFLLYSNAMVVAVRSHGVPGIATLAVPLLLAVPFAYHVLARREPLIVPIPALWMLGYLGVLLVSGAASADPTTALSEVETFVVEGLLLYLLVVNVIRSPAVARHAVWTLLVAGALMGGLSVFQAATGAYDQEFGGFAQLGNEQAKQADALRRLAGPIGEQNRYAQVLVVLVPLALVFAWRTHRRGVRIAALVSLAAITGGVVLTFSRGAGLGLGVALVTLAALRVVRPRHFLAVVGGVVLLLALVPSYRDRLSTLQTVSAATAEAGSAGDVADGSVRSRATENIAALLAFGDHIALGVGPGQFPAVYQAYAEDLGIRLRSGSREAHSLYLGVLAETGIAGAAAITGIMASTVMGLLRARRSTDPDLRLLADGLLAAVATYLTTGFFLHISYGRYLWTLLAVAGTVGYLARRPPTLAPPLPPALAASGAFATDNSGRRPEEDA